MREHETLVQGPRPCSGSTPVSGQGLSDPTMSSKSRRPGCWHCPPGGGGGGGARRLVQPPGWRRLSVALALPPVWEAAGPGGAS